MEKVHLGKSAITHKENTRFFEGSSTKMLSLSILQLIFSRPIIVRPYVLLLSA